MKSKTRKRVGVTTDLYELTDHTPDTRFSITGDIIPLEKAQVLGVNLELMAQEARDHADQRGTDVGRSFCRVNGKDYMLVWMYWWHLPEDPDLEPLVPDVD